MNLWFTTINFVKSTIGVNPDRFWLNNGLKILANAEFEFLYKFYK